MNKFNYIIEFSDDIQKQVASDLKHKLMKSFNNETEYKNFTGEELDKSIENGMSRKLVDLEDVLEIEKYLQDDVNKNFDTKEAYTQTKVIKLNNDLEL